MIKVELIAELSINTAIGVSMVVMSELCWMDLIINFLAKDRVLNDEKEVDRVHWVAVRY